MTYAQFWSAWTRRSRYDENCVKHHNSMSFYHCHGPVLRRKSAAESARPGPQRPRHEHLTCKDNGKQGGHFALCREE